SSPTGQGVKKAIVSRGYKVEIIDTQTLSYWLKHELHIEEEVKEDQSHFPGYDAFITYICSLLARNGIITLAVSVSPHQIARLHAREQLQHFIEVYVHCPAICRYKGLQLSPAIPEQLYEAPVDAELNIDTSLELPERSALRIISYIEQSGYIAPLWEELNTVDEEISTIIARLQSLGYLD
ncbi:MAG: adenylyl-sulfate kinase, partial [Chloroflexota bacterium]|nr:adenylyl-sulfate kinase [Chloroflexota bacterium]